VQARLADEQWEELITSDTPFDGRWEKYVDTAAEFLKQLQDAKVPVLWRPIHENNGGFFWWSGMVNYRLKPAYSYRFVLNRGDPMPAN